MLNTRTDKVAFAIIVTLAVSRLIAPWPNFNPVLAMALLGGAMITSRYFAILIPLSAMAIGDAALGLVNGSGYALHDTQWVVYTTIAAIALLGRYFTLDKPIVFVAGGGTVSGVVFFLTTNAAAWYGSSLYPQTFDGLMMSYAAGLAFARQYGLGIPSELLSTWLVLGVALLAIRSFVPHRAPAHKVS